MTLRDAHDPDLKTLYEFEKEIIHTERPFDTSLTNEDFHYYDFQSLITSQNVKMIVAEIDKEIVGSGFAEIKRSESYLKHSEYAYIGLMYVVPSHRGKGINSQILQHLKTWITGKGVTELRLMVYQANEDAKNAYLKAGFKPHVLEMRLAI